MTRVRHHGVVSTEHRPTKQERREAARAARLEAEQADAAHAVRRRRLRILLAVLGAAAVLVVVAIVVSGGSSGEAKGRPAAAQKATGAIPGEKESAAMLAGIPQSGIYLGNPAAPSGVVEFADLQCPFCRDYSLQVLPQLVQDYVRSGKVRMEFRTLSFLGKDSVTAGRAAAAAAQQNRLWNFADVFYFNQGEENSGYVTPSFLQRIVQGRRGRRGQGRAVRRIAGRAEAAGRGQRPRRPVGVQSTPTILVGKRGGKLTAVQADPDRRRAPSSRPSTGRWGRRERPAPAPVAIVLALIGLGVAGYLTYVHYAGIQPVCGIGAGCEKVQTSEWAELAGVPVALLGLLGYAGILAALFIEREEALVAAALIALVGFGFSAYLTYRELFTIDAICLWCVASAVVMTLLAIVTTARLLRAPTDHRGAIPYVG